MIVKVVLSSVVEKVAQEMDAQKVSKHKSGNKKKYWKYFKSFTFALQSKLSKAMFTKDTAFRKTTDFQPLQGIKLFTTATFPRRPHQQKNC